VVRQSKSHVALCNIFICYTGRHPSLKKVKGEKLKVKKMKKRTLNLLIVLEKEKIMPPCNTIE